MTHALRLASYLIEHHHGRPIDEEVLDESMRAIRGAPAADGPDFALVDSAAARVAAMDAPLHRPRRDVFDGGRKVMDESGAVHRKPSADLPEPAWRAATIRTTEDAYSAEQMRQQFDAGRTFQAARNEDAAAALLAAASAQENARLEKPARVGCGTFGIGVPSRLVVEAAQRLFEFEGKREAMTPDEQRDMERRRRELWDRINGPFEAQEDARDAALQKYEAFFDQVFAQACSNGLFDAWGKRVDCTRLNEAHQLASAAKKGGTQ